MSHDSGSTAQTSGQALAKLRDLYGALSADPADTGPWRDWLITMSTDGPEIAQDPEALAVLQAISALPGYSGRVKGVLTNLRSYGRPTLRVYTSDEDGPLESLTDLLADEGYTDAPAGLFVPPGYTVAHGQISSDDPLRRDPLIASRLVAVVGRATDAETGEASVTLAWAYGGGWCTETVSRYAIADARALVALSRRGCPVDSTTAADVVRWLARQEAAAVGLPDVLSMERCGWTPDMRGFLVGARSLGREVRLVPPGDGERGRAEGYRARGTLDGWITGVWDRCKDQPAGLAVLALVCAPLLQVLDAPGFTLDVGGPPGTGKSAACKAALSVSGDPAKLWNQWAPNWPGVRGALEFGHSVGVMLDDTKFLLGEWDTAQRAVYTAFDRASQPLGQQGGGTQRQRAIRAVVLSTGESAISEHCADAAGAAERVLRLVLPPFASPQAAVEIHEHVEAHHGHVLTLVVRWLLDHAEQWPALRKMWKDAQIRGRGAAESSGIVRVSQYPAMLEVAAHVLRLSAGLEVPRALTDLGWQIVHQGAGARDNGARAWEYVQGYGAARPDRWAHLADARTPYLGAESSGKDDATLWTPEGLTEALESGGYQAGDIVAIWAARGWLLTVASGGHQIKRSLRPNDRRVWVYALRHDGGPDREG